MASPAARLARPRQRSWVERARMAALADRMLEVDRFLGKWGEAVLSPQEAEVLRSIQARLAAVPA
jgi:hypothetical protein